MLILKILDHDLHRSRRPIDTLIPMTILVPDNKGHSPVLVSSTRGKFIVRRKLFQGAHPCGIFPYDSDRLDELIGPMVEAALQLSLDEKWDNVLSTPKAAFEYIQQKSGTTVQPHVCLIPADWKDPQLTRWAGKASVAFEGGIITYRKTCRIYRCNTATPIFLSRPDFVGLFTQIVGGMSSVLLHNVRHGMAFCRNEPSGKAN